MSFCDTLAMRLRAAYFSIRRSAQQHLASTGASVDHVVLLTLLVEKDGLMQRDLVERAFSDPSTIRQLVVSLEERGWVRREVCPDDARARRVYLTAEGRRQQRRLKRIGRVGDASNMEDLLTPAELKTVLQCLQRIAAAQPVNQLAAAATSQGAASSGED